MSDANVAHAVNKCVSPCCASPLSYIAVNISIPCSPVTLYTLFCRGAIGIWLESGLKKFKKRGRFTWRLYFLSEIGGNSNFQIQSIFLPVAAQQRADDEAEDDLEDLDDASEINRYYRTPGRSRTEICPTALR